MSDNRQKNLQARNQQVVIAVPQIQPAVIPSQTESASIESTSHISEYDSEEVKSADVSQKSQPQW